MSEQPKPRGPIRSALVWAAPKPALWINARQISGLASIIRGGVSDIFRKREKVVQSWDDAITNAQLRLGYTHIEMQRHLAQTRKHFAGVVWSALCFTGLLVGFLVFAIVDRNWWYAASLLSFIVLTTTYAGRAAFRAHQIDQQELGGLMAFLKTPHAWLPK